MGITKIADQFATGNFVMGALCVDCYHSLYGSGEWENMTDGMRDKLNRYEVLPGHLHGNDFDDRCYHGGGCDWNTDECDCEAPSFSSHGRPCFICDDRLDGDRYDIVAVDRD